MKKILVVIVMLTSTKIFSQERNYFYEKAKIKIKTDDLKLGEIINLIIGSLA